MADRGGASGQRLSNRLIGGPAEADGGHGSVTIVTGAVGVVPVRPTEIRP